MRSDTSERRRHVRTLLATSHISSQSELQVLLANEGFQVTQATISRDLDAVGAVRLTVDGTFRYSLAPDRGSAGDGALKELHEAVDEFVESFITSGNLILMKVPPGAAQLVASRIDAALIPGALGTIAGDDTILVVVDEGVGAREVSHRVTGRGRHGG